MKRLFQLFLISLYFNLSSHAAPLEVLHWWTSGSEAKSMALLKQMLEKEGVTWKDFAVAGGGGENAMTILKTRVVAGNPPASAQIKGPAIHEWAAMGVLAPLDEVAKSEKWATLLPPVVQKAMQYGGQYVAVPVNVHRVNWLWANPAVFKKAGASVPTKWDDFAAAAEKLKKAGFTPVAHGGQPWQDATVFESIVLGMGGPEFYKKTMINFDAAAIQSETMHKIFAMFRTYQSYTDKGNSGRDWNLATAMLIQGKAGMQIMGDWAKGEFANASKQPGKDYVCMPVPDTQKSYTFNIDSFVMFKNKQEDLKKSQFAMAKKILTPEFQNAFNMNKGSIPVRTDVDKKKFDACGQKSIDDFAATSKAGTLLPSMAHNMAVSSVAQGSMFDVITKYFNSTQTPKEGVSAFLAATQSYRK